MSPASLLTLEDWQRHAKDRHTTTVYFEKGERIAPKSPLVCNTDALCTQGEHLPAAFAEPWRSLA